MPSKTKDGSAPPSFTTAVSRLDGEAVGEYGQVTQQMLFRFGQQLVTPIEHRLHGPMPRQRRAASTRQHYETVM